MKSLYPISTAIAALLLTGPLALAQTSSEQPQNSASGMHNGHTSITSTDRRYLDQDARGAAFELQLSQLASQKARDPQVRQFAEMIVQQHTQANQQLEQVAQNNGVTLPTSLNHRQRQQLSRLEKLNGAAFDQAYVADMNRINRRDVQEEQKEASATQNPQIRQFVQQEQQMDQQHAQAAQALQKNGASKG